MCMLGATSTVLDIDGAQAPARIAPEPHEAAYLEPEAETEVRLERYGACPDPRQRQAKMLPRQS